MLYTQLVNESLITLDKLIELIAINPRKRFNIPLENDYTVWDLGGKDIISADKFISKGKAMPWEGTTVYGVCQETCINGNLVYKI